MTPSARFLSRLSGLPIFAKMTLAPVMALLLIAVLSVFGWGILNSQQSLIMTGYSQLEPELTRAIRLPKHLNEIETQLYRYVILRGIGVAEADLEDSSWRIGQLVDAIWRDIDRLTDSMPEGGALLAEKFRAYETSVRQALVLAQRDPALGVTGVRGTEELHGDVYRAADRLAIAAGTDFRRNALEIVAQSDRFSLIYLLVAVGAGAGVILVSYLLSRSIATPIGEIVQTLDDLRSGDFTTPMQHTTRPDELGAVARAIQQLRDLMLRNRGYEEERERQRADLEYQAMHDGLTGLANRQALEIHLRETIDYASRSGTDLAYMLIDLDGFKPVNDSYGHAAGDRVLTAVAERLGNSIRYRDGLVVRMGGDEFGIVFHGLTSRERIETVAGRITGILSQPVAFEGKELQVGVSIGIAFLSDTGPDADALLAAADAAMYAAKTDPRSSWRSYCPSPETELVSRHSRDELETALRLGQIRPHYQPKVALASGALVGFEALARWDHPERGLLLPGQFLADLDQFGMQADFTLGMVRRVLLDLRGWTERGLDPGTVAINFSEATLATPTGLQDFEWLLAEFPDMGRRITVELTENVFTARSAHVIQDNVARLVDLGCRIAMDDFGTGYASFQHLRRFPFHELKIDMEFIAGIGRDRASEVIIDGFLAIASGLGAEAVAEGIETEAQAAHMERHGCQYGQGHLFGRACPADEVPDLIAAGYLPRRDSMGRAAS